MDNYCLLDIDGVVLDWESGLAQFMQDNIPHIKTSAYIDPHAYDIASRYGITKEEANSIVWDFHYDERFRYLQPIKNVEKAIEMLLSHFKIVAITACGTDEIIVNARNYNLNRLFPNTFESIWCVDRWDEKRKYLQKYPPGHWAEDHLNNYKMGLEFGHTCWLIDAPYNQSNNQNITRVSSLLDVANAICC